METYIFIFHFYDIFIVSFTAENKRKYADTTYAAQEFKSKHIINYFKNVKVKDITYKMACNFLDSLFIKQNLSTRTVKDIRALLNSIMNYAVENNIISINPIKNVSLNKELSIQHSGKNSTDDDFFSFDEAMQFLKAAKGHELYALFFFTLFFGLRREEVLGLRWDAIDFKNRNMKINHTVTKGTKINRNNATKTDSSTREYPLNDEQIEMLLKIKRNEERFRNDCGSGYIDNDYIFKHDDGSLYYPDYPTKAFKKIIERNPDLPQKITFHGLRSSCVSILVHDGYDIKTIQRWVGHKDFNTTLKIYAKVKDRESKKEILNGMGNLLHLDFED